MNRAKEINDVTLQCRNMPIICPKAVPIAGNIMMTKFIQNTLCFGDEYSDITNIFKLYSAPAATPAKVRDIINWYISVEKYSITQLKHVKKLNIMKGDFLPILSEVQAARPKPTKEVSVNVDAEKNNNWVLHYF